MELGSLAGPSLLSVYKKFKSRSSDRSDSASSISSLIVKESWASSASDAGQPQENWPEFHRILVNLAQRGSFSGLLSQGLSYSVATVRVYWPTTIVCALIENLK